jgi:glycosyltransferase involved in cell wall biosynthesis
MTSSSPDHLQIPAACLSVVVPCYNEEKTILTVLAQVLAQPSVGEVLVVDDGSRDRSAELVRTVSDPRVRLLVQPRNFGKGAALRRGLAQATRPYVIIQDADLEYNPEEYPVLLEPLVQGRADVVYGSRFHSSHPHRVLYFWHSLGNQFLTLASNMATDLNLTDMETCYKVFRREVLQEVIVEEDRFGFEPEITAKVAGKGFRIFEVGISYSGRTYAEGKKIGWKDGVRAMYCIARYGLTARWQSERQAPKSFDEADRTLQPSLESLDGADHYAEWIESKLAPHLHGRILEVGAGRGTFTTRLTKYGEVVATEKSEQNLAVLRERFANDPKVEVRSSDDALDGAFDAIVLVNVLEHIEDDVGALSALREQLKPGGTILVFAPALPQLMSEFDRSIGHFRRYERAGLTTTAYRAGLEVVANDFVNSVGAGAWWLVARQLGRAPTGGPAVKIYDNFVVPWLRKVEERFTPPIGQSLFLVARRPEDDASRDSEPRQVH